LAVPKPFNTSLVAINLDKNCAQASCYAALILPYRVLKHKSVTRTVPDILGFATTALKEPYILSDPDNFTTANPLIRTVHIQPE
jgi:hypothetical protein